MSGLEKSNEFKENYLKDLETILETFKNVNYLPTSDKIDEWINGQYTEFRSRIC